MGDLAELRVYHLTKENKKLKQRELELMAQVERLTRHRDILADHMAEVKAIADGCDENTLTDVVSHCVGEINQLRYKADKALGETPQQSLAERDADVAAKAHMAGQAECGCDPSWSLAQDYANQLRQQVDKDD